MSEKNQIMLLINVHSITGDFFFLNAQNYDWLSLVLLQKAVKKLDFFVVAIFFIKFNLYICNYNVHTKRNVWQRLMKNIRSVMKT